MAVAAQKTHKGGLASLPRNIWAVSVTSFLMDVSSEMVLNLLPLFLNTVLGVKTNVIGLIEGVAEATASLLRLFSGWLSDKVGARKWLAVLGYALSAVSKPFFYFANSWASVAAVRWIDRVGKGVRTAPRDALVADSIAPAQRGLAFGFHRAADTAGAATGLLVAFIVLWRAGGGSYLRAETFRLVVLASIVPAFLAVLTLALGAREPHEKRALGRPQFGFRGLGRAFAIFMVIVALFDLGNSSDAFLILRAQRAGLNIFGILGMLLTFNLVYALVSTPAGVLSDRIGRRALLIGGWFVYAAIYFGFALASRGWQIWLLYSIYGVYYGMAYGAARAMIADIVPADLRATAYGTYAAVLGVLDFPASALAGILWDGIGPWHGFGPGAPFAFGGALALLAALLMALWDPRRSTVQQR